ncbi:hypothetical protein KAR91_66295 [Candidatus Pacearchaeota archaeon]|nr:hypothetical protein [Candidatus Pacearchaeota archaeon]
MPQSNSKRIASEIISLSMQIESIELQAPNLFCLTDEMRVSRSDLAKKLANLKIQHPGIWDVVENNWCTIKDRIDTTALEN